MLTHGKPTLITGDFNICFLNHGGNRMSKGLEIMVLSQRIKEARGGNIDHVYWRGVDSVWTDLELELYCPYSSDHYASEAEKTLLFFLNEEY
jgi:hypothetical protein